MSKICVSSLTCLSTVLWRQDFNITFVRYLNTVKGDVLLLKRLYKHEEMFSDTPTNIEKNPVV